VCSIGAHQNSWCPVSSSLICLQERWWWAQSGKLSGTHCCAPSSVAGAQECADHVHSIQWLDIQWPCLLEHWQSHPHWQFWQEVCCIQIHWIHHTSFVETVLSHPSTCHLTDIPYLFLGLLSVHITSTFLINVLYTFLVSKIWFTFLVHCILLDFTTITVFTMFLFI